MEIPEHVLNAALAGLLHDVGKFAHRAGIKPRQEVDHNDVGKHGYHAQLSDDFVAEWVPKPFQKGLLGVRYHHRPVDTSSLIIQIADRLAAGERRTGELERTNPEDALMVPILSQVHLKQHEAVKPVYNRIRPLSLDRSTIFPTPLHEGAGIEYKEIWGEFITELELWKNNLGDQWDTQEQLNFFITLLALLRKYTWCVPAATPWEANHKARTWPDVSLFEHLRLTSALAACLTMSGIESEIKPGQHVALIVRGDVSGIQKFIYSISRPGAETEHIAKRLRGRSMYLSLLVQVVADWILRNLGLPPNCALYVGGGRFDLLVPLNARPQLAELINALEEWMLDEFFGELSIQLSVCPLSDEDLKDMRRAYRSLDDDLNKARNRKWQNHLKKEDFFQPQENIWHVCQVCQLTPLPEPDVCDQCNQQVDIGKHLPYTTHLIFMDDQVDSLLPPDQIIHFPGSPFQTKIGLIREEDQRRIFSKSGGRQVLYKLNSADQFILPAMASSFLFIGNSAPRARKMIKIKDDTIRAGDVLHFEALAELSNGAKRIGVLKADVDLLGLVMSIGLDNPQENLQPTLSRVASLSSTLDLFFSGYLNRLCEDVFREWREENASDLSEGVDGCFYLIYSGGDDLFLVGPWDATLLLAERLQSEFSLFCGSNPDVTISAGYVQVKPRYPVQKFAEFVEEALKEAKSSGRNRISAFGQVMEWQGIEHSFQTLMQFSDELVTEIEGKRMPRTLINDLGELYRQHLDSDRGTTHLMWTPRLYYTLARRLSKEVIDQLRQKIVQSIFKGNILFPVSVVSLKTRKE